MHKRLNAGEFLGRYADNCKLDVVHADGAAHYIGIRGEALLPGVVGKNRYRIAAGDAVFFRCEGAAERGFYLQRPEKVPAHGQGDAYLRQGISLLGYAGEGVGSGSQTRKGFVLVAQVDVIRIGDEAEGADGKIGRGVADGDDLARARDR